MLKRLGLVVLLVIACGLPLHAAVAGENVLTGTVEAYRIIKETDGHEAFVPAKHAQPKDVIEYRLTYRNTGDVPVTNVAIIDPVPAGMQYIPQSAIRGGASAIEYSIDHGKTYHDWPVMRTVRSADGTRIQRAASPDMITHIRWMVDGSLAPSQEITVTYRASVQ